MTQHSSYFTDKQSETQGDEEMQPGSWDKSQQESDIVEQVAKGKSACLNTGDVNFRSFSATNSWGDLDPLI